MGRKEVLKEETLDNLLKGTREGHRQSDEYWNCFKGIVGEPAERRGKAHMVFSERIDTILN